MSFRLIVLGLFFISVFSTFAGGRAEDRSEPTPFDSDGQDVPPELQEDPETVRLREQMVVVQIEGRRIADLSVLEAMRDVPRHIFMPRQAWPQAYEDHPVPIGEGQTISQPYVVALMTESLQLEKEYRVLEIGTGSGYQAAVLARICNEVYTVEIKEGLHKQATATLEELQYSNVITKHADGYFGWEKHAPFDAIMITAAVNHIPPPLIDQLKEGGRLILPLGDPFGFQELVLITKKDNQPTLEYITGVLFVPMTGRALE